MTQTTETTGASTQMEGSEKLHLSDFVDLSSGTIADVSFTNDVRIVTSQAEFKSVYAELAAGAGGVIKLSTDGGPYTLSHYDVQDEQVDAPVMITSLTPEDPAVLQSVYMRNQENFHLSDLRIEEDSGTLVTIQNVTNSGIYESEFVSDAEGSGGVTTDAGGAEIGASGADIRQVENFSFVGNELHHLFHGVTFRETVGLTYTGNELHSLQGDGMRLGGVQDALIEDNWFHDFLGSTHAYNHSDFIQIWGKNIWLNNQDITIRSNFLDNSSGPAYQAIFGHNEDYETNGLLFENIVVENNVLWGSSYHGISLSDTLNMTVSNNTLIFLEDAYTLNSDGSYSSLKSPGWIDVDGIGALVEKNVGLRILVDGDNATLTHGSSTSTLDQLNQYTNLMVGETGDLRDITLLPDSELNGVYGSSLLWFDETPDALMAVARITPSLSDRSVYTLDASLSRGPDGLVGADTDILWTLDDGRTFTGAQVEVDFETAGMHGYTLTVTGPDGATDTITRSVEVEQGLVVDLAMVDGAMVNTAADGLAIKNLDTVTLENDGLRLGEADLVEIDRSVSDIYNLSAFDFSMTLDLDEGSSGTLMMIYESLQATIDEDGAVAFGFSNGDTWFTARSEGGLFDDGPVHLSFVYDGALLRIYADGEVVAETEASGSTQHARYWGLTFGNPWKQSVEGLLSNLTIKTEASSAEEVAGTAEELASIDLLPGFILSQTLFEADFSSPDIAGMTLTEDDIVTLASGESAVMVAGSTVELSRSTGYLYEADSFDISLTAQHLDTATEGTILYLHETLSLSVRSDGRLAFTLTTDEGTQIIRTPGMPLADGALHDISLGYDAEAGVMQISVDGEVLVQGEQTGLTPAVQYWGMTIGHPWAGVEPQMAVTSLGIADRPMISEPTPIEHDADTLIFLDFDGTVHNEVATAAMPEVTRGALSYTEDDSGTWARFEDGASVGVSRYVSDLHARDSFEFVVDIRDTDNVGTETVFEIYGALGLTTSGDDFHFTMKTESGTASLHSDSDILADGEFHEVRLGYDAEAGRLSMMIDGTVVDEVAATGPTAEEKYWGLTIGSNWGNALEADLSHFSMNETADWLTVS